MYRFSLINTILSFISHTLVEFGWFASRVVFWVMYSFHFARALSLLSMSSLEDEIRNHFEAEPLSRFVYARHEGQCYYSSMTQCFYEVDHRTNLLEKSKNIQENQWHCQDIFGSKDTREPRNHSKSPRESVIGAIHKFDSGKHQIWKVYFENQWGKVTQWNSQRLLFYHRIKLNYDLEYQTSNLKKDMKLHYPVVKIKQSTPMNPRAQ